MNRERTKKSIWIWVLVCVLVLGWSMLSLADFYVIPVKPKNPAPVPKTGLTSSSLPGDDGGLQKGVAWPYPRFTKNGDGTVTDNLTGLIWLENANCTQFWFLDITGQNPRAWSDALTAANALEHGYCGLSDGSVAGDWRLPNRRELDSLLDMQYCCPFLSDTAGTGHGSEGDPFSGVLDQNSNFWSSTTAAGLASYAFVVSLADGQVLFYTKGDHTFKVWPVRGGQ